MSSWDEAFKTPVQKIVIKKIPEGSIIDIGGGGEGFIGQIGGENVTAIDSRQSEIDEAKPNAPETKWVLADATELPFEDEEFDNATAFFSGMFMTNEVKKGVFQETFRVTKRGGELWYWDANMRCKGDKFIIILEVTLPNGKTKRTGYGNYKKEQSPERICEMMGTVGFQTEIVENNNFWYFIKGKKEGKKSTFQ